MVLHMWMTSVMVRIDKIQIRIMTKNYSNWPNKPHLHIDPVIVYVCININTSVEWLRYWGHCGLWPKPYLCKTAVSKVV